MNLRNSMIGCLLILVGVTLGHAQSQSKMSQSQDGALSEALKLEGIYVEADGVL